MTNPTLFLGCAGCYYPLCVQGNKKQRHRKEYEDNWQQFLLREKRDKSLHFDDIPWIFLSNASHSEIKDLVLSDVDSSDATVRRKQIRLELTRSVCF